MKTKNSFILLGLFGLFGTALLGGCSGGGDANEMAPLSDEELLKRGAAGHEAAGGGQQPMKLPEGAPPPSMPSR